ncbi:DUF2251 domain-containing protein [Pseudomonas syringae]|nr:DUF2251 domain-containing protein [Pseudomonas syringae]
MPIYLAAEETLNIGQAQVIDAPAQQGPFCVTFEDDEDTGYFYALDMRDDESPVRDALHIYNVDDVSDRITPSTVKIGWSMDHAKAVLLINDQPHAVFDFQAGQGYCRTGFPPPASSGWSVNGHDWNDAALELFA